MRTMEAAGAARSVAIPTDDVATEVTDARRATGTAVWVLVVQCLLALSWTLYVLFLPGMLAKAGVERRWFVYVLIADQAIFGACDWAAGAFADRIGVVWRRLGRFITVVALLSSAALLAMPWVATGGNAALLLGVIFVWAGTSSALRAPVFALIGRVRESGGSSSRRRAGMVSIALVGISLAGAIGPYITLLLKAVDPRLPIAVSAASLALAGLWALRADAALPQADAVDLRPDAQAHHRRRAWSLAGIVMLASFGTQLVTAIVAQPLLQRFVGNDAVLWATAFWIGFAIGLVPGARVAATDLSTGRPLIGGAVALVVACAAFAIGVVGDALAVFIAGLTLSGAAWGVFTTVVFTSAVSLSDGRATVRGAGTASGLLFSAIAVGTLLRLALVAAGLTRDALVVWLPDLAWLSASALLVLVVRRVWRHPVAAVA